MIRLFAFVITFFVGLTSGTLLPKPGSGLSFERSSAPSSALVADIDPNAFDPRATIMFDGWEHGSDNRLPRLRFVVYNGTDEQLYYSGYSAGDPWPVIRVGKEELRYYWCGTGVGRHTISPGESMTFEISGEPFKRRRDHRGLITVGLNLSSDKKGKSDLIETTPFSLPSDFVKELDSLKD